MQSSEHTCENQRKQLKKHRGSVCCAIHRAWLLPPCLHPPTLHHPTLAPGFISLHLVYHRLDQLPPSPLPVVLPSSLPSFSLSPSFLACLCLFHITSSRAGTSFWSLPYPQCRIRAWHTTDTQSWLSQITDGIFSALG